MPVVVMDSFVGAPSRLWRLLRGRDRPVLWGTIVGVGATLGGTAVLAAAFLWPSDLSTPSATSAAPSADAPALTAGLPENVGRLVPSSSAPSSSPASRPATTDGSPTAVRVPLTARFAKVADGLSGYPAAVTVSNEGSVPITDWTVTLTLPRSTLTVSDVSGATVKQDGAVWTFTPDATTAQVEGGKSVTVSLRVSGATLLDAMPTGCTIDGHPCQGVG